METPLNRNELVKACREAMKRKDAEARAAFEEVFAYFAGLDGSAARESILEAANNGALNGSFIIPVPLRIAEEMGLPDDYEEYSGWKHRWPVYADCCISAFVERVADVDITTLVYNKTTERLRLRVSWWPYYE